MRSLETHPKVRRLLLTIMDAAMEEPVVSPSPFSLWLGCCGERDTEAAAEGQTPNPRCNPKMNKKRGSRLSSGCTSDIQRDFSLGCLTMSLQCLQCTVLQVLFVAGRGETHRGFVRTTNKCHRPFTSSHVSESVTMLHCCNIPSTSGDRAVAASDPSLC
jgi:hypothetical protein